jgi:SAM-dependent methyltransferase
MMEPVLPAIEPESLAETMDLTAYRASARERERTESLLRLLVPGQSVLEIGARDGHFSRLLPDYFSRVTALDLTRPDLQIPGVATVAGDIRSLQFEDRSFDCVFCSEVLEHIDALDRAAVEIARVAKKHLVIGVPYRQDLRWGKTTCRNCYGINPAWGHLHSFDEGRLAALFPQFSVRAMEFVSSNDERTNPISSHLFDFAHNPWGRYNDEDRCSHCGSVLDSPPPRNIVQKVCSKFAATVNHAQSWFVKPWPFWIHLSMERKPDDGRLGAQ